MLIKTAVVVLVLVAMAAFLTSSFLLGTVWLSARQYGTESRISEFLNLRQTRALVCGFGLDDAALKARRLAFWSAAIGASASLIGSIIIAKTSL